MIDTERKRFECEGEYESRLKQEIERLTEERRSREEERREQREAYYWE